MYLNYVILHLLAPHCLYHPLADVLIGRLYRIVGEVSIAFCGLDALVAEEGAYGFQVMPARDGERGIGVADVVQSDIR